MNEEENLIVNQEKEDVVTGATQENEEVTNNVVEQVEQRPVFTQEQVNDIVRERLNKQEQRLFSRYGIQSRDDLDVIASKANSYDVMVERFDKQKQDLFKLNEELAFLKNNINVDKYDDIRAYFKGKNLNFNNENLVSELATHSEWLAPVIENKKPITTIKTLGIEPSSTPIGLTDAEKVAKLFGLKKI